MASRRPPGAKVEDVKVEDMKVDGPSAAQAASRVPLFRGALISPDQTHQQELQQQPYGHQIQQPAQQQQLLSNLLVPPEGGMTGTLPHAINTTGVPPNYNRTNHQWKILQDDVQEVNDELQANGQILKHSRQLVQQWQSLQPPESRERPIAIEFPHTIESSYHKQSSATQAITESGITIDSASRVWNTNHGDQTVEFGQVNDRFGLLPEGQNENVADRVEAFLEALDPAKDPNRFASTTAGGGASSENIKSEPSFLLEGNHEAIQIDTDSAERHKQEQHASKNPKDVSNPKHVSLEGQHGSSNEGNKNGAGAPTKQPNQISNRNTKERQDYIQKKWNSERGWRGRVYSNAIGSQHVDHLIEMPGAGRVKGISTFARIIMGRIRERLMKESLYPFQLDENDNLVRSYFQNPPDGGQAVFERTEICTEKNRHLMFDETDPENKLYSASLLETKKSLELHKKIIEQQQQKKSSSDEADSTSDSSPVNQAANEIRATKLAGRKSTTPPSVSYNSTNVEDYFIFDDSNYLANNFNEPRGHSNKDGTIDYYSVQQEIVHTKALLFEDEEIATAVMSPTNAASLANYEREIKNVDEDVWKRYEWRILLSAVRRKFAADGTMQQSLMKLSETYLLYASTDKDMGVGLTKYTKINNNGAVSTRGLLRRNERKIFDVAPGKWDGRNLLGSALMFVRSELQEAKEKSKMPQKDDGGLNLKEQLLEAWRKEEKLVAQQQANIVAANSAKDASNKTPVSSQELSKSPVNSSQELSKASDEDRLGRQLDGERFETKNPIRIQGYSKVLRVSRRNKDLTSQPAVVETLRDGSGPEVKSPFSTMIRQTQISSPSGSPITNAISAVNALPYNALRAGAEALHGQNAPGGLQNHLMIPTTGKRTGLSPTGLQQTEFQPAGRSPHAAHAATQAMQETRFMTNATGKSPTSPSAHVGPPVRLQTEPARLHTEQGTSLADRFQSIKAGATVLFQKSDSNGSDNSRDNSHEETNPSTMAKSARASSNSPTSLKVGIAGAAAAGVSAATLAGVAPTIALATSGVPSGVPSAIPTGAAEADSHMSTSDHPTDYPTPPLPPAMQPGSPKVSHASPIPGSQEFDGMNRSSQLKDRLPPRDAVQVASGIADEFSPYGNVLEHDSHPPPVNPSIQFRGFQAQSTNFPGQSTPSSNFQVSPQQKNAVPNRGIPSLPGNLVNPAQLLATFFGNGGMAANAEQQGNLQAAHAATAMSGAAGALQGPPSNHAHLPSGPLTGPHSEFEANAIPTQHPELTLPSSMQASIQQQQVSMQHQQPHMLPGNGVSAGETVSELSARGSDSAANNQMLGHRRNRSFGPQHVHVNKIGLPANAVGLQMDFKNFVNHNQQKEVNKNLLFGVPQLSVAPDAIKKPDRNSNLNGTMSNGPSTTALGMLAGTRSPTRGEANPIIFASSADPDGV